MPSEILVVIDNYAHADLLPIVALHDETAVVFCDHRTPLRARAAVISPMARELDVSAVEVSVAAPDSTDCSDGYHQWQTIGYDGAGLLVAARCARCGTVERHEPVPAAHIARQSVA